MATTKTLMEMENVEDCTITMVCPTKVVLPDALNANLEVMAFQTGVPKNELVIRAIVEYLADRGLNPHKNPKIKVSY